MTHQKVTDRQAVLDAIKECDKFGNAEFLKEYGYGEARDYVLVEAGSHYDSKAIYGVAHKFQHGRVLGYSEFKGGLVDVVVPLRNLGFEIFTKEDLSELDNPSVGLVHPRNPDTFIVLWNPANWEWSAETRSTNQQEILQTGVFMGDWALGSRRSVVQEGDRFFLLKVGALPRGVIAAGRALGPLYKSLHWDPLQNGKMISYADIAWEVLLDEKTLLPKETLERELPNKNWTIQKSGTTLAAPHAEDLEQLWMKHLKAVAAEPGAVVSTVGTGIDVETEIERGYTTATVKRRKHQQKFRLLLLGATNEPKCFVCGFDEKDLLEAAHIIPDSKGGPSNLENGRLLCVNHHRAHDKGMFKLEKDKDVWAPHTRPFGAPRRRKR